MKFQGDIFVGSRKLVGHLNRGTVLLLCIFLLGFSQPAFAVDLEAGAQLFKANCASCHALGSNRVVAAKTLKKAALEKYGTPIQI